MAIKTYKKGDATKLSTNFRAREFDCHGVGCCTSTPIDEKLVEFLQKIRDHFKKPVIVTAYRCKKYNAKVANAVQNSYHTFGQAADIHIDGVKPAEIAKYAESIGVKGIGLYEGKDGNFVHIDTRTSKSFWYGHAQVRRTTFGGAVVKEEPKNNKAKIDTVKEVQNWANTNYKSGLTADGVYGAKTKKALVKILQIELNQTYNSKLVVDGIWGAKTKDACKTLKKGVKNDVVKVLQALLVCNGYSKTYVTGNYGSGTYDAVKSYQSKNELTVDGIAGKNTFDKLCG